MTWKKEAEEKRKDGERGLGYDKIGSALDLEGWKVTLIKPQNNFFLN